MSKRDALKSVTGTAMLAGCGIAAAQSALELADCNCDVCLVEEEPSIVGAMAQLEKTFLTNDCAM
jgi:heterodisulfide reductase subunit A